MVNLPLCFASHADADEPCLPRNVKVTKGRSRSDSDRPEFARPSMRANAQAQRVQQYHTPPTRGRAIGQLAHSAAPIPGRILAPSGTSTKPPTASPLVAATPGTVATSKHEIAEILSVGAPPVASLDVCTTPSPGPSSAAHFTVAQTLSSPEVRPVQSHSRHLRNRSTGSLLSDVPVSRSSSDESSASAPMLTTALSQPAGWGSQHRPVHSVISKFGPLPSTPAPIVQEEKQKLIACDLIASDEKEAVRKAETKSPAPSLMSIREDISDSPRNRSADVRFMERVKSCRHSSLTSLTSDSTVTTFSLLVFPSPSSSLASSRGAGAFSYPSSPTGVRHLVLPQRSATSTPPQLGSPNCHSPLSQPRTDPLAESGMPPPDAPPAVQRAVQPAHTSVSTLPLTAPISTTSAAPSASTTVTYIPDRHLCFQRLRTFCVPRGVTIRDSDPVPRSILAGFMPELKEPVSWSEAELHCADTNLPAIHRVLFEAIHPPPRKDHFVPARSGFGLPAYEQKWDWSPGGQALYKQITAAAALPDRKSLHALITRGLEEETACLSPAVIRYAITAGIPAQLDLSFTEWYDAIDAALTGIFAKTWERVNGNGDSVGAAQIMYKAYAIMDTRSLDEIASTAPAFLQSEFRDGLEQLRAEHWARFRVLRQGVDVDPQARAELHKRLHEVETELDRPAVVSQFDPSHALVVSAQLGTGQCVVDHYVTVDRDGAAHQHAIKFVASSEPGRHRVYYRKMYRNELAAFQLLEGSGCPNVVKFAGTGIWQDRRYIALELCDQGSLARVLRDRPMPPLERLDMSVQLLRAVRCVHQLGLLHNDITVNNVFVKTGAHRELVVKLGDFGLAVKVDPTSSSVCDLACYSPDYLPQSPESAAGSAYGLAHDVYCVGLVLLRLLCEHSPLEEPLPPRAVPDHLRPEFDEHRISFRLEQMLVDMLVPDPEQRPTAAELVPRAEIILAEFSSASTTDSPIGDRDSDPPLSPLRWQSDKKEPAKLQVKFSEVDAVLEYSRDESTPSESASRSTTPFPDSRSTTPLHTPKSSASFTPSITSTISTISNASVTSDATTASAVTVVNHTLFRSSSSCSSPFSAQPSSVSRPGSIDKLLDLTEIKHIQLHRSPSGHSPSFRRLPPYGDSEVVETVADFDTGTLTVSALTSASSTPPSEEDRKLWHCLAGTLEKLHYVHGSERKALLDTLLCALRDPKCAAAKPLVAYIYLFGMGLVKINELAAVCLLKEAELALHELPKDAVAFTMNLLALCYLHGLPDCFPRERAFLLARDCVAGAGAVPVLRFESDGYRLVDHQLMPVKCELAVSQSDFDARQAKLEQAANQGHAWAQATYALSLPTGDRRRLDWWQRASDQGFVPTCQFFNIREFERRVRPEVL